MIRAYQLVDLKNPKALFYLEHSRRSLEPVSDLIELIPYQCYTPATIPKEFKFKDGKKRSETEKAALASHARLAQKRQDEFFIAFEHDAYLWPEQIDNFRSMLKHLNDHTVAWFPGIAMECYLVDKTMAKKFADVVTNDSSHMRGPMAIYSEIITNACVELVKKGRNIEVIWPVNGGENKSCRSTLLTDCSEGKGTLLDAPITQHVDLQLNTTIVGRDRNVSLKNNPNVYWTDGHEKIRI